MEVPAGAVEEGDVATLRIAWVATVGAGAAGERFAWAVTVGAGTPGERFGWAATEGATAAMMGAWVAAGGGLIDACGAGDGSARRGAMR